MFENLSDRLRGVVNKLTGQGRLTEDNIKDSLREVRMALLEADVALDVVKSFVEQVKTRALGQEVLGSLTPGQTLIKIVNDELTQIVGEENKTLDLTVEPPAVILMAGLQGSGKTTSAAKLAKWLKETENKKVMVASADVYRPAAILQLQTLANEVDVSFFQSTEKDKPVNIAKSAISEAKKQAMDVVIIDTAGRLHIDDDMMSEIKQIHHAANPIETLFVIDSMMGQDAVTTAKAFDEALALTGIVLTKVDGDSRGGAALSVRQVTGKPIKFLGVGEKTDALEPFFPDRLVSRLLGMGDMMSLIEEAERKLDKQKATNLAKKLKKGKGFTLEDYRGQLLEMKKMGNLTGLLDKVPGMGNLKQMAADKIDDGMIKRTIAIIDSMTIHERHFPAVIRGSRKKRIAAGSGTNIQEVNKLLKQFTQMQKMMKKLSKKGGMSRMMQSMQGMMPPGGMGGM